MCDGDEVTRLKAACVSAERHLLRRGKCRIHTQPIDDAEPSSLPTITLKLLVTAYPRSPLELLDRALLNLSNMVSVSHPGDKIKLSTEHPTVLFSKSKGELFYVIDQFHKLNYIGPHGEMHPDSLSVPSMDSVADVLIGSGFCIQTDGWRRIGELARTSAGGEPQAFVAMWFDPSTDNIYEHGIEPAIEEDCGIKCIRIDNKEHNNKICDEIVAEIRRSTFLVADFTGQRPGVYFEAGFARGLGIPVISTVQKPEEKKLHFDTRQYNHIVYTDPDDLRKKLANRIRATIA